MNVTDFNSAKLIQETISKITSIQTRIALDGSKGHVMVVNPNNMEVVSGADILAVIGEDSFNTICEDTLTTLNTTLATAKADAQTAFEALGAV